MKLRVKKLINISGKQWHTIMDNKCMSCIDIPENCDKKGDAFDEEPLAVD